MYFWYFLLFPLILLANENPMIASSLDYFRKEEPQLFRFWLELTPEQQQAFESQLQLLDLSILERQKEAIRKPLSPLAVSFDSFDDFSFSGNAEDHLRGQRLIEAGRVGCLVLAGGQGTRLRYSGPKGTYPISLIKQKTLFQLCAEKVVAASRLAGRPLNLAIMTSPENDAETRLFFKNQAYFGLSPSQVFFFIQSSLPLLDREGHLFLKSPEQLSMGADGNGCSLPCFVQSGIWEEWRRQGVEFLNVILVDNPLADPFDAELIGFLDRQGGEVVIKCTEKKEEKEKVGLLVKQEGRCKIVEYSEIEEKEKGARRSDGRLKHCCANLSLFCFSMSFIRQLADRPFSLPLHQAWKGGAYVDEQGETQLSSEPFCWKFETFIFDWLPLAKKVFALLYPREECFAPLKNWEGADSPEKVRAALQRRDKQILEELTGLPAPSFPFELAADFYYPSPALRKKWGGRFVTSPYVEP